MLRAPNFRLTTTKSISLSPSSALMRAESRIGKVVWITNERLLNKICFNLFSLDSQAYLFDKRLLTDGTPPNDRGCRWCGKIGHIVKECPNKQQKREKKREAAGANGTPNERRPEPVPPPPAARGENGPAGPSKGKAAPHKGTTAVDMPKGTFALDALDPLGGVLNAFLRCDRARGLMLEQGLLPVPNSLYKSLCKGTSGLIIIRLPPLPRVPIPGVVVVYDKFKRLSSRQFNVYLREMSVVAEALQHYLDHISVQEDLVDDKDLLGTRLQEVRKICEDIDLIAETRGFRPLWKKDKKRQRKKTRPKSEGDGGKEEFILVPPPPGALGKESSGRKASSVRSSSADVQTNREAGIAPVAKKDKNFWKHSRKKKQKEADLQVSDGGNRHSSAAHPKSASSRKSSTNHSSVSSSNSSSKLGQNSSKSRSPSHLPSPSTPPNSN